MMNSSLLTRLNSFGLCLAVLMSAWLGCAPTARAQEDAPKASSVMVKMRDGKELAADVYLPVASGKYPCILIFTPYNKKLSGAALPEEDSTSGSGLFDREHYAYVIADWRGYYGSRDASVKNSNVPPMRRNGQDGHDLVEWIAAQEWSNGKVGMWGPSALGRVQFATAAENPEHLVCIAPVVAACGERYSHYYRGGVLLDGHLSVMEKIGYAGIKLMVKKAPAYTGIWKIIERNLSPSAINVPCLMIGGWFDTDVPEVLATFHDLSRDGGDKTRADLRLLMGPWTHTGAGKGDLQVGQVEFPDAADVSAKFAAQFFAFHLRGDTGNGWDKQPKVTFYQMHGGGWTIGDAWPPKTLQSQTWHLYKDGGLKAEAPAAKNESVSYDFDPTNPSPTIGGGNLESRFVRSGVNFKAGCHDQSDLLGRSDTLVFTTDALQTDLAVQGAPQIRLYVSTDAPDTDFAVRLCDVDADGKSWLVGDGIRRLKFRESYSDPQLAEAGKTYELLITLDDTAWTFRRGHQVRILVSSSNAPRYAVNPNTGDDFMDYNTTPKTARNTVHLNADHPSALLLPVNPAFNSK